MQVLGQAEPVPILIGDGGQTDRIIALGACSAPALEYEALTVRGKAGAGGPPLGVQGPDPGLGRQAGLGAIRLPSFPNGFAGEKSAGQENEEQKGGENQGGPAMQKSQPAPGGHGDHSHSFENGERASRQGTPVARKWLAVAAGGEGGQGSVAGFWVKGRKGSVNLGKA